MPTPAEPEESQERRVVEPIRVLRPRNTDALAELFREMTELTGEPVGYEAISLPVGGGEAETERLPPVGPDASRDRPTGHAPDGAADREGRGEHHGAPGGPPSEADWDWAGKRDAHGSGPGPDGGYLGEAPSGGGPDRRGERDGRGSGAGPGGGYRRDAPSGGGWDWAGESDGSGAGTSVGAGERAGAAEPGGHEQDRFSAGAGAGAGAGRAAGGGGGGRPGAGRGRASQAQRAGHGRVAHGMPSGQGPRDWAGAAVPGGAEKARRAADGARSGAGLRRAAVTVGVCAAALVGFAGALLLPGRGGEAAAQTPPQSPTPTATASPPTSGDPDPDGAGTLREGDSGPEVTDLQKRLLRIPDVYKDGATDGSYNAVLTEAVARFQLWYGIRGDEDGVYGDDTREALESRTAG